MQTRKDNMEIIRFSDKYIKIHFEKTFIEIMDKTIEYARHLNKEGKKSVSHPLPGSDYLHRMLKKKLISHDVYEQLLRLAEDPTMEYKIILR